MRAFTPEISWHNRLPALSLDISKPLDEAGNLYRVATGGNDCRVYIWLIDIGVKGKLLTPPSNPDIRIRAGLRRHQKSVGAVRFSCEHILASGDDDGYIYLWKHKTDQQPEPETEFNAFVNDDGFEDLEVWHQLRVLRGHIEDICDLAWSKDGQFLLSGSVDNSAILWDAAKGIKLWCSDLIKGYVQGVAIDPHAQFMAAISSDRTLRVYNFSDKRLLNATRRMNIKGKFKAFFCDDTVQTFCRRLEFSPDGQFLLAPTSRLVEKEYKNSNNNNNNNPVAIGERNSIEQNNQVDREDEPMDVSETAPNTDKPEESTADEDEEGEKAQTHDLDESEKMSNPNDTEQQQAPTKSNAQPRKSKNVFLVFKRSSFNKPAHYYPTGREVALCARFSPVLYKLKDTKTNFWGVPYRIVFAVATTRSVLIYDSQQPTPIGYSSQIHLARLTDLAWSHDGRLLMISSYDGYNTILTFDEGEFGEIYTGPMLEPVIRSITEEEKALAEERAAAAIEEKKKAAAERKIEKEKKEKERKEKIEAERKERREKIEAERNEKRERIEAEKREKRERIEAEKKERMEKKAAEREEKRAQATKKSPTDDKTTVDQRTTIWKYIVKKA